MVIPKRIYLKLFIKDHSKYITEVPDDQLAAILPVVKKIAKAIGSENYNILQVF